MSRCECGQLFVPVGSNVTLKFYEGGNSTSMTLAHTDNAFVSDGESLLTYGVTDATPSITPDRIFVEIGSSSLYINSVIQIIITVDGQRLASRYVGVKYDYWMIPEINGVPTITLSCRSILKSLDVSNKTISVEFKSICDTSSEDCCSDSLGEIQLSSYRGIVCVDPTTTEAPEVPIYKYTPDCPLRNCREDVNGNYTSFHNCLESLQQCSPTTTTTTTVAPTTQPPSSTTTTTTTTTTTLEP